MEYGTVNKLFAELLEGRIMEGHALQSSKISRRIFFSLKLHNFNHICQNYHENFYNNLLLTLRKVP